MSTIRRVPNLFGDHFHPTLMLFAPLVRLGDLFGPGVGTRFLLIGQAAVVCGATFPVWRFARRRLDAVPSLLLTAADLVSWGLAQGIAFDVHDTCWSALGIAFLLDAYDRRIRWRIAADWAHSHRVAGSGFSNAGPRR